MPYFGRYVIFFYYYFLFLVLALDIYRNMKLSNVPTAQTRRITYSLAVELLSNTLIKILQSVIITMNNTANFKYNA